MALERLNRPTLYGNVFRSPLVNGARQPTALIFVIRESSLDSKLSPSKQFQLAKLLLHRTEKLSQSNIAAANTIKPAPLSSSVLRLYIGDIHPRYKPLNMINTKPNANIFSSNT